MTITKVTDEVDITIEISAEELVILIDAIQVDQVVTEEVQVDTSNCYRPTDVYQLVDTIDGISVYKGSTDRYIAWYGSSSRDEVMHEDIDVLVRTIKTRL